MAAALRTFKFGWYGDGGLGDRTIEEILSGRKSATSCLAYEAEDAGIQEGDKLELVDKRGTSRGRLLVVKIEIRLYGAFDEGLAAAHGMSLEKLKELTRFANGREPFQDEEMRVVFFRLIGPKG
jgi:uncharacterized protein YhfF